MIGGCSEMLLLLFKVCSEVSMASIVSILVHCSPPVHRLQGFANGIVTLSGIQLLSM
jgi:hypothetical protein